MSTRKDYKPLYSGYEDSLRRDAQVSERNTPVLVAVIIIFVIGMVLDGVLTRLGVL